MFRGMGDCYLDEANTIPCPDNAAGLILQAINPQTGKSAGGAYFASPVYQNPNQQEPMPLPSINVNRINPADLIPAPGVWTWIKDNSPVIVALVAVTGLVLTIKKR